MFYVYAFLSPLVGITVKVSNESVSILVSILVTIITIYMLQMWVRQHDKVFQNLAHALLLPRWSFLGFAVLTMSTARDKCWYKQV